jgi:mono/diheme cytochrome c family protein
MKWHLLVAGVLIAGAAAALHAQRVDITPTLVHPSLRGRDIFDFYCASCHGLTGTGNGPVAAALTIPPADLTKLARTNGGTFPRARVEAFVTHGGPDVAAHGSPEMPTWGPIFRALEPSDKLATIRIQNVVAYIESLQGK